MKKSILLILIGKRKEDTVKVQQVFTAWGCIIKTRLGIHDGVLENCSDEQKQELTRKGALIPGVSSKLVELSVNLAKTYNNLEGTNCYSSLHLSHPKSFAM